jgi:hypothetical protein
LQFLNEGLAVQPALLDHRADALLEYRLFSGCEGFGREHDDWDVLRQRGLLKVLDEREAVHAWHEQVE